MPELKGGRTRIFRDLLGVSDPGKCEHHEYFLSLNPLHEDILYPDGEFWTRLSVGEEYSIIIVEGLSGSTRWWPLNELTFTDRELHELVMRVMPIGRRFDHEL